MVGDWFRFRYTIDGKEIVHTFRISRIEDELGDYYVWGKGFGRMCYPKRLEPISITPEILEKNGFEEFDGWRILDMDDVEIRWIGTILEISGSYGNIELPNVQCVHELQHALRLCGIDKEIVI